MIFKHINYFNTSILQLKNIYAKSTFNHNPLPQEIEYLTLLKGENFRRTESICYTNKIYINTGEHNISRFLIKITDR